MTQITINREIAFANKFRKIKIYIDNKLVGKIKEGEKSVINVEKGKHEVYAQIDWCSSKKMTIEINANENKQFALRCTNPLMAIYYIIFRPHEYLILESSVD